MPIRLIVLAAGKGTRMKSALPKVLHRLAGRPLLARVLDTGAELGPDGVTVVVGHGAAAVREAIEGAVPPPAPGTAPRPAPRPAVDWVEQTEQLGTGHAVRAALPSVGDDDLVLVTYGDVPLIRAGTLSRLLDAVTGTGDGDGDGGGDALALLTVRMADATGYGRIVREGGRIVRVVEQKDAAPEELAITEANAGVIAARGAALKGWLARVGTDNAQGEYYLTDVVGLAAGDGAPIRTVHPEVPHEVDGVNSRAQLAALERLHQRDVADALMASGATLADPARIDVRGTLVTGTDVEIDVNCTFEGRCRIGDGARIGPGCTLLDTTVAAGATVRANSVIESSEIGEGCDVGPFARLRPGTRLAAGAKVGNFVETKNASVGPGSKINHLSYVGDAELGRGVNVGAGTITCNYDGANKHVTRIGDGAFIGSNSSLVAPIDVEAGATVGAGSTLGRRVEANSLTFTRAPVTVRSGWARPVKKKAG